MANISEIMGLPPISDSQLNVYNEATQNAGDIFVRRSFPTLHISPCLPNLTAGIQGFELQEGDPTGDFSSSLSKLNVSLSGQQNITDIKYACLNVNPPSETFSNEFGASFLDNVGNFLSSGTRDLTFILGDKKMEELVAGATAAGKSAMNKGKDVISNIPGISDIIGDFKEASDKVAAGKAGEGGTPLLNKILSTAGSLVKGSRLDMPTVWKDSTFGPSYSFSIKLFNPYPGDKTSTEIYIAAPIAILLLFVAPRSEAELTYKWPFLTKFWMPGLIQPTYGYIKSVSVVKGGDDNTIAMNQRMAMADVKIDMGILYSSLVNETSNGTGNSQHPTLEDYYNGMLDEEDLSGNQNIITQVGRGYNPLTSGGSSSPGTFSTAGNTISATTSPNRSEIASRINNTVSAIYDLARNAADNF